MTGEPAPRTAAATARTHLRFGWWALFAYLLLGLCFELFHAFKVQFYLGAEHDTRRMFWTLAHSHGTLLGLINVAFAAAVGRGAPRGPGIPVATRLLASRALQASTLLLPGGFFLGGAFLHSGDPGLGVLLAPLGGVLLLLSVLLIARSAR